MKSESSIRTVLLAAVAAALMSFAHAQNTAVNPARGGGLDTNAPMIHVDIFYDYAANEMHANLDTSHGNPKLVPLPPGYTFDASSNFYVLYGKAYNFQLAWNPGGIFASPAGAALWIECLSASPGLECYDGPGNKMINPPRTYAPIFGTAGSSPRWQWYGAMAHNSYAVLNPSNSVMTAQYRIYFGDAETGAPDAYTAYDDALVTLNWTVDPVTVVEPARAGGLVVEPMIHVDIFYDSSSNKMNAVLDTSHGIPSLRPLPAGYTFDARSNYYVFNGKAYNFQYAWNPGGLISLPPGAAFWIECLSASPGLECFDGPGNRMISPPRTYAPIFGTGGSSTRWQWYGKMAHNSYAVLNPTSTVVSATYRLYFGDAITGDPAAFAAYDDEIVTLTWNIDVPREPAFLFGAADETSGALLSFLNEGEYATNSMAVVNLRLTNSGPCSGYYACCPSMIAVPATEANGGPATNHAALGARLEMQWVSLQGPPGGALMFWEPGESAPALTLPVGETAGTGRALLSENDGAAGSDPYGAIQGRHFATDKPGLYCLGFRVVDTSTNGPAEGPVHGASPMFYVYLQSGANINQFTRLGSATTMRFGGEPMQTYYLERCSDLSAGGVWETVAGPLTGTSRLQSLTDPASPSGTAFYRLRITKP